MWNSKKFFKYKHPTQEGNGIHEISTIDSVHNRLNEGEDRTSDLEDSTASRKSKKS